MLKSFLIWMLTISGLFFTLESVGYPATYQFGADIDERLIVEDNYLDSTTNQFDLDETYNILSFYSDLHFSAGKTFGGYILTEISWTHSWESGESDEVDFEVINAYISFSRGRVMGHIGRQSYRFGGGLILDNDEPGIKLTYWPSHKVYLEVQAAQVWDSSPMASATLGYRPGFLEKIELFGVWFSDDDDGFAGLLNQTSTLIIRSSDGDLYWYGANADIFVWDVYLSGTGVLQRGTATAVLDSPTREFSFDLSSYLIDMEAGYNVTEWLSAGAFCFVSSGDRRPAQGDLKAFFSPLPYNSRTAVFFSGGVGDSGTSDALSLGGVRWAGVVAPGITLDYQYAEDIAVEMTLAFLLPEDKPSENRDWYGWETDIFFSYAVEKRKEIFLEVGVFQHGDFFESSSGYRPDPASRFICGFNAFF